MLTVPSKVVRAIKKSCTMNNVRGAKIGDVKERRVRS